MTNHPNRSRAETYRRIKGDWMRNGYVDNFNRRRGLDIVVIGGKAYYLHMDYSPDTTHPVTVDKWGHLPVGGDNTSFLPDEGEIDRIGRQYFKMAFLPSGEKVLD